jgi:putative addiction module component (TIGR02574 family)
MSVEQIEEQIQRLPLNEQVRLAEWFNGLLASLTPPDSAAGPEWQETPEVKAELDRRLAEFKANPAIAVPFEPDYFDQLKRQLVDERAQKAPAR